MWSTSFDIARFLILCVVVFLEFKLQVQASRSRLRRSESKCPAGTYRSPHYFGDCAECPENCELESNSDIKPCRRACDKIITIPTPVIDTTQTIRRDGTTAAKTTKQLIDTEQIDKIITGPKPVIDSTPKTRRHAKPSRVVWDIKPAAQQLSNTKQIAILVGIPAIVIVIAIVMIVTMWKSTTQRLIKPAESLEETVISVSDPATGESDQAASIESFSEAEIAGADEENLRLCDRSSSDSYLSLSRETEI